MTENPDSHQIIKIVIETPLYVCFCGHEEYSVTEIDKHFRIKHVTLGTRKESPKFYKMNDTGFLEEVNEDGTKI